MMLPVLIDGTPVGVVAKMDKALDGSTQRESDFKIDRCDACGAGNMQEMSGCKRLCRQCGFLRSCSDTV